MTALVPTHTTALPWRDAHELAGRLPVPLGMQRISLDAAAGRVLAESIRAAVPLPGCDVSAMDGYAVTGEAPWRVLGRVLAGGAVWPAPLMPGTAVEIMTGAPVPVGASAVVPYEDGCRDGDVVSAPPGRKPHIRLAGEDARPGDELVPAGQPVTAAVLGVAAQAGLDALQVYRRPRVHVLVTGDEVISAGVPRPGQVRDALGPSVAAVVQRAGGMQVERRYIADGAEPMLEALRAATDADVVVVSGSSSVGVADHLHGVLDRLGARWHIDGVRCRPGHPQALAETADGRWVIGLPGNPFAGLAAALTMLEPVVAALAGRSLRPAVRVPVTGDARPYPGGVRLEPARLVDGQAVVIPARSSASLRAAAVAHALAVIEATWRPGDAAELLPLP